MTATRRAWREFSFALANPGTAVLADLSSERAKQYTLGWSTYTNEAFSALSSFATYAAENGLYPKTRGIYNPVTRLVDCYASHIFPGVLSIDGENLPDGEMLAIPLAKDTPDEIKEALGQLWQWGNWQENMDLWVVYCASMGDGPVEPVENVERGRVFPKVLPPAHIPDVAFDDRDNVISYVKEYRYYDRNEKQYFHYKKEVNAETIREYRDDKPYDFGNGAAYDNPYGFAPLVWNSHRKLGTLPGAPAVRSWRKIEDLNSLATRVNVYIRVQSQSPNILFGSGKVTAASLDATKASEEVIKLLQFEGDGSVAQLQGNLDIAAAESRIQSMIAEIEHDHPEITMYNRLREMGTVTGPAAEKLMGDVKGYITRARAGYDAASVRLFKMLLTMGGMRANERKEGWADLTEQQKKFLPFNLQSYERGELDFSIASRPLLPKTNDELWKERDARYLAIRHGMDAGVPLEYQLREDGMSDEEWNDLLAYQNAENLRRNGDGFPE